jgi:predicted glycoside hydrolase/deacetylase ChbG (UPF0249 family)
MSTTKPLIDPADLIANLPVTNAGVPPTCSDSVRESSVEARTGLLIINADDWGRSRGTTDAIVDCVQRGAVSSVSAMVFMDDSERAASIAQEQGTDAGLHLNLTTAFSAPGCSSYLLNCQQRVAKYLLSGRFARTVFHPGLIPSFEYLVKAHIDEFRRLYQRDPDRIDGHHHMHLCANVLLGNLLPQGTIVRRNFSFARGEKSYVNLLYRQVVDHLLARKHRVVDYFFKLPPIEPVSRLQQIFGLAPRYVIELETHPAEPEEYKFLAEGELFRLNGDLPIARRFAVADDFPRARRARP